MKIHSGEIVPYPMYDEYLFRCWGCGARVWAQSEQEALDIAKGHRDAPYDAATPQQVHAVLEGNDKGSEKRLYQFESDTAALGFIASKMQTAAINGRTYAYLTGYRSPKFLASKLALDGDPPALEVVERRALEVENA